ncbi:MAG: hypothetical protein IJD85_00145 [Oscillospiraceae bacterium]|nr:hypothetical protein [Oscillospiraceae bacterium]
MNFFKRILNNITTNYRSILLAFFIAIFAWFFVSIQIFPTIEESIKGIDIETQATEYMLQNNLQIVSYDEKTADIRIEGKRYDISGLSADSFFAELDLSSVKSAGTFNVPVKITCQSGTDYTLLSTEPRSVSIEIDEIVTREYPVTGTAPSISLPEGYYVDEITTSPATISITGSASVLDKIDRIEARSVYAGAISESHDTQSELFIYGTNGARIVNDDLILSTENVSVYIPIYKQKELPLTFTLTNVPNYFNVDSLKYEIQPSTITVAAPDDSIDYLSVLDIGTIDISDIKLNQTVTIPITLPEGYKNLSGNNNARVVWDISDYGKLDFVIDNINVINVPDNYNISLITKELVISVMGPSEILGTLSASDFFVSVNLLGVTLRDGTQDVSANIQFKGANSKCWVSGSYKATIYAEPKITEEG